MGGEQHWCENYVGLKESKRWEESSLTLIRRCNVMLTVQYVIESLLAMAGYLMGFGWQPSFVFQHHFALGAMGLPSSLAFAFLAIHRPRASQIVSRNRSIQFRFHDRVSLDLFCV